jgi:hypothetical protein
VKGLDQRQQKPRQRQDQDQGPKRARAGARQAFVSTPFAAAAAGALLQQALADFAACWVLCRDRGGLWLLWLISGRWAGLDCGMLLGPRLGVLVVSLDGRLRVLLLRLWLQRLGCLYGACLGVSR